MISNDCEVLIGALTKAFAAAKLQVKTPWENIPRAKSVFRLAALASASAWAPWRSILNPDVHPSS